MVSSGFYAWDKRAVQVLGSAEFITPRFSSAAQISNVKAGRKRMNTSSRFPSTKTWTAKGFLFFLLIRENMTVVRFHIPIFRLMRG